MERQKEEKIKALISLLYKDEEGRDVEFTSAKEFKINYVEEYIGVNFYVIISISAIAIIILLLWIISIKTKNKCKKCLKRINKKMKICPYCLSKQNK